MDEDEVGQGEGISETSVNTETFEQPSTTETQNSETSSINPSWNEALELLPDDYLKGKLTPVFEKWEKNNNSRFEKVQQQYSPYKDLVENNVSIDDIREAYRLRNEVQANPQVIFERLASHLGYDINLLKGEQSQGLENDDPEGGITDPRIAELEKRQEQSEMILAEQLRREEAIAQQQKEQTWINETKSELDRLESSYGKFDRNRAVQFAVLEHERTGAPVSIEAGVKALLSIYDEARKTSANATAPLTFSGSGGLPSGAVDTSKMSEKELEQYVVGRMAALNGS